MPAGLRWLFTLPQGEGQPSVESGPEPTTSIRVDNRHARDGHPEEVLADRGNLVFCIGEGPNTLELRCSLKRLGERSHMFEMSEARMQALPPLVKMVSTVEVFFPGGEEEAWKIVLRIGHGLYSEIQINDRRLEVVRDMANITQLLDLHRAMYNFWHRYILTMVIGGNTTKRAGATALVTIAWVLNMPELFKDFTRSMITHQFTMKDPELNPDSFVHIRVWEAIAAKQAVLGAVLYNVSPTGDPAYRGDYQRILKSITGLNLASFKEDWMKRRFANLFKSVVEAKLLSLWPYPIVAEAPTYDCDLLVAQLLQQHALNLEAARAANQATVEAAAESG
ncbi:hypothetical protein FE257_008509 [Aspergillus nanangensis]|uniref:Uncharacterized protein n=1 Tax=Aspergillus nanangensis TaxID=2582783 RepID=A0AAD4CLL0_ASPNN|nr:hypothetical protein FE257_008509 [Aspergillus nanangensis]